MLTITATVLSAVLLVAAVLVARDRGAPAGPATPAVPLAANQAIRIDPATYEPAASVAVGTDPAAVVGGGGSVWVASRRDGTVSVVDRATNRVQVTIPASGSGPVGQGGPGLAFASGSLWVANYDQRQVVRVEPDAEPTANRVQETVPAAGSGPVGQGGPGLAFASGSLWLANTAQRQVARVELGAGATLIPVGASPIAIAAARDADDVWVAARTQSGGGLVARIDALTNQVHPTVRLPYPPSGLAITPDGRSVWVATPADKAIRRIGTGAGRVVKRIELPQPPDQVAYGDDAVWVTSSTGNAVLRINAATSKVEPVPVGNGPGGIAFGADRVWVANSQDGTVSAIDPQTNQVATRRLGFRPAAVAVVAEQRAVWVALAA